MSKLPSDKEFAGMTSISECHIALLSPQISLSSLQSQISTAIYTLDDGISVRSSFLVYSALAALADPAFQDARRSTTFIQTSPQCKVVQVCFIYVGIETIPLPQNQFNARR